MTNGFALNNYKSLQIYFLCVKRQAKNNLLKDVESTVVNSYLFLVSTYPLSGQLIPPKSSRTWFG